MTLTAGLFHTYISLSMFHIHVNVLYSRMLPSTKVSQLVCVCVFYVSACILTIHVTQGVFH